MRVHRDAKQYGFTLLEVLFSMVIIVPFLVAGAITLRFLNQSNSLARISESNTYRELRLRNALREIVHNLDTYRFNLFPRIHHHGQITFSDGSLNPISNLRGAAKPDPHATAITSMALSLPDTLTIQHKTASEDGVIALACPRYQGAETNERESYLGVSEAGYIELWGKSFPHTGRPHCRDFMLHYDKSMLVPPATEIANGEPTLLIPIVRYFTLYLDRAQTLHYVGHRGAHNIERQPIDYSVNEFSLTAETVLDNQIFLLNGRASFLKQRALIMEYANVLGREEPYNFILNQP